MPAARAALVCVIPAILRIFLNSLIESSCNNIVRLPSDAVTSYGVLIMTTRIMATTHEHETASRTGLNVQPFPKWGAKDARQALRFTFSDAAVAVQWLNAAKEAKATAAYQRVLAIRQQLEEFGPLRVRLREYGADSHAEKAFIRKLEEQRALVKAGQKAKEVRLPAINYNSPIYKRLYRQAEHLHSEINEALLRYTFVPRVTFFIAEGAWLGGMAPKSNSRWFETKIQPVKHQPWISLSEPDAVLSLVRLDLTGEIAKVRLCENCGERWRVATKSDAKFCSAECRQGFYAKRPEYHARKAANQRKYRMKLKQRGL